MQATPRLSMPLLCATAIYATSFSAEPPVLTVESNCAAAAANLMAPVLDRSAHGLSLSGSLLNASVERNPGFGGCILTWTSARTISGAPGPYRILSRLTGDTFPGLNLGQLGGVSLAVDTFLLSHPGTVATAAYQFPMLTSLHPVNVTSPALLVDTAGNDILVQRVRLQFGGSALPAAARLSPSLLASPSFTSTITAESGPLTPGAVIPIRHWRGSPFAHS